MNKILTIIIPTYNMEKYLRRCLDSLIIDEESMKKLEVLVINDGSKDSSSQIAHEYQDKYPDTYRVIDKDNGNYGSCINRGLKEATGKYIKVLDADDYFDNLSVSKYQECLKNINADLIITNYNIVDESGRITRENISKMNPMEIYNADNIINTPTFDLIQMHAFTYNRHVFDNLNYHQTEGISYTDQEWIFTPMANVNTIVSLPLNIYQYFVGRIGQTMDPAVLLRSLGHTEKGTLSMLSSYKQLRVNEAKNTFLKKRILNRLNYIYTKYLLDSASADLKDLQKFDNIIKEKYPAIYSESNNLIAAKKMPFKYVKHWRKTQRTERSILNKLLIRYFNITK